MKTSKPLKRKRNQKPLTRHQLNKLIHELKSDIFCAIETAEEDLLNEFEEANVRAPRTTIHNGHRIPNIFAGLRPKGLVRKRANHIFWETFKAGLRPNI